MGIQPFGSKDDKSAGKAGVKTWHQQGFTLIEMLIAVAVLAVSSMIIIPAYQNMIARQALSDVSSALLGSLLYARNQAITHHHPVRLCPRGDQHECGQHWQEGWQIMMADGDRRFRTIETSDMKAELVSDTYGSGSKADPILFNTMGHLASAVSGFRLANRDDVRYVCLTMSGQASVRLRPCSL